MTATRVYLHGHGAPPPVRRYDKCGVGAIPTGKMEPQQVVDMLSDKAFGIDVI